MSCRPMSGVNEIRSTFLDYFARNGHEIVAVVAARAAQRPDADVHQCRHGAVQERLHRRREAALFARRDRAEMRARRRQAQRPRQCRLYRAPSHLLRDARQLLLRRLLQGGRDRARLEPDHQGVRAPETGCGHGLHDDDEAFDLWKKIAGLPDSKIIRIADSDNFWAMGDTGPCGPCSEIFYDHGDHIPGGPPGSPTPTATASSRSGTSSSCSSSSSRGGKRVAAAAPSIDTGMGLERIAAVLQGTHDNYEIDLFARADRRRRRSDRRRRRRPAQGVAIASSPTICAPPRS